MGRNLTPKILAEHLVEDEMVPSRETALRIDQCLIQDATGEDLDRRLDGL
jgi:aconitate hydratase